MTNCLAKITLSFYKLPPVLPYENFISVFVKEDGIARYESVRESCIPSIVEGESVFRLPFMNIWEKCKKFIIDQFIAVAVFGSFFFASLVIEVIKDLVIEVIKDVLNLQVPWAFNEIMEASALVLLLFGFICFLGLEVSIVEHFIKDLAQNSIVLQIILTSVVVALILSALLLLADAIFGPFPLIRKILCLPLR